MIYIIDKENTTIHMVEYYGKNHRYYTRCGTIINKTDRVNTLNLSDYMSWVCPACINYCESSAESGDKNTRWSEPQKHSNLTSRLADTIVWYEKGYAFVSPEGKYDDEIVRDTAFMRKMHRYASRKHRKPHVY